MTEIENTTVADRLRKVRDVLGLNPRQFALSAKIDPSQYAKVEKGKQKLGADKLYGLSSTFSINMDWLQTGEGEMFNPSKNPTPSEPGEAAPDAVMPGSYQDIVAALIRGQDALIRSQDAQVRITDALLEERQLRKNEAQAQTSAPQPDYATKKDMEDIRANLSMLQTSLRGNLKQLQTLQHVVAHPETVAGKSPTVIEGILLGTVQTSAQSKTKNKTRPADN